MSLATLISTVQKRISNINEETILNLLDIISNEDIFTEQILLIDNISIDKCRAFLEILVEEKYIENIFRYECEIEGGDSEIALTRDENCLYCHQPINSTSHLLKNDFRVCNNEIHIQIEDYIEGTLERFVDKAYIPNLKQLKIELQQVVPFLGSGISIPLGLPNWVGLIRELENGLVETEDLIQFNKYLDYGDIFNALDLLINESVVYSEKEIKTFIKDYINRNLDKNLDESKHNINDLLNLNSDFYITTNYDNSLTIYKDRYSTSPFVLDDITDMQELLKEKERRIIHMHGIHERKETMVVTINDYNKIYENEKNKDILSGIMAQKKFLFIGFSFTDKYFEELYTKLRNNIGGTHFIILANMHNHHAKALRDKGLKPISLIVKSSSGKLTSDEYTEKFVSSLKQVIKYLLR